jgi:hypothetical protein
MILNVCFLDYTTVNVGEALTQPADYFEFGHTIAKVPLLPFTPTDMVSGIIIGGGGLVRRYHNNAWLALKEVVDRTPDTVPIVIWGMGINDHGRLDRRYDETLLHLEERRNVLIGLRDCFYDRYVPCVSCMRPELAEAIELQEKVGVYFHHSYPLPFDTICKWPAMSNEIQGDRISYFRRVVQFLGSCETVVTNTYHGAYWATLLNRRVIVLSPFSNKFMGFKYEPVIIKNVQAMDDALKLTQSYPDALSDSRKASIAFYKEAQSFLRRFGAWPC